MCICLVSFRSIVDDSSSVNLLLIKIFDVLGRKWNYQFLFGGVAVNISSLTWRKKKNNFILDKTDRNLRNVAAVLLLGSHELQTWQSSMMIFNENLKTRNWCWNILISSRIPKHSGSWKLFQTNRWAKNLILIRSSHWVGFWAFSTDFYKK